MWKGVAPLLAHHAATGTSCCGPECEIVFKRECVYLNTFKCIYTYIYMYARCTFIFTHYMYLYVMRVYINICGIYMQYINIYIYLHTYIHMVVHISSYAVDAIELWHPGIARIAETHAAMGRLPAPQLPERHADVCLVPGL